jgi:2-dehydro-3-deoxy-D-arabinonate dehydratase
VDLQDSDRFTLGTKEGRTFDMYLTRHQTLRGPRWALDGHYLPPRYHLSLLLEHFANIVPLELSSIPTAGVAEDPLLPPLDPLHEVWASEVTYLRSLETRKAVSEAADVYDKAYSAERPELFLKAVGRRVVGHGQPVRTRSDSRWNVPEPELVLVLNQHLEIVGYTAGNDVSSRDIEGENPLFLPQAKVYDDSCAIGPGILIGESDSLRDLPVELFIERDGIVIFQDSTRTSQMDRQLENLVAYLGRELDFPDGTLLMTGTGIVPPEEFSLRPGDEVRIVVGELTLENRVALPEPGSRLSGWSSLYEGQQYRTIR